MEYKLLGRTGLRVSELCLGTVVFGGKIGDRVVERDEAGAVFDAFVEAGGNFFDTADKYQDGRSEEILGELIHADRERFVVATKYGQSWPEGRIVESGNGRRNMRRSLEGSLRRLKTDYVDLFYVHNWDFTAGWEEMLIGLDELVRSGKTQYVAICNTPAWEIARGVTMAELRGWDRLAAVQLKYNLSERSAERELFPMALELGLAVLGWQPFAQGVLAGLYPNSDVTGRGFAVNPKSKAIAPLVGRVASELGISPTQVCLAWYRKQGERFGGQLWPIFGADNPDHVRDNVASLDVELPDAAFAELNELTAPELGYPHDYLINFFSRENQLKKHGDVLVNHRVRDPRYA